MKRLPIHRAVKTPNQRNSLNTEPLTASIHVAYHGSSKPLECFTELELAPNDALAGAFSFCGTSTSISSSLELFELVGAVESTSISSAILFVSRVKNLAPKIDFGPNFPRICRLRLDRLDWRSWQSTPHYPVIGVCGLSRVHFKNMFNAMPKRRQTSSEQ